jgi:hypothetical protein
MQPGDERPEKKGATPHISKKVGDFFNLTHNGAVLPGTGVLVCGV